MSAMLMARLMQKRKKIKKLENEPSFFFEEKLKLLK